MKSHVAIFAMLIAANGVGMSNEQEHPLPWAGALRPRVHGGGEVRDRQERSPIIYWIDSISYSEDVQVNVGSTHITRIEWGEKNTGTDSTKDTGHTSVQADVSVNVDSHASISTTGSSAGVDARSTAGIKFQWQTAHDKKFETMTQRYDGAAAQVENERKASRSDFKLRFNLNFSNMSTNQTFEYKTRNGKLAGLFVVVPDKNGELHRIPVVLPEPSGISSSAGFDIRANGGKVTFPVEVATANDTYRGILRILEIRGELDKKISIQFDDNFHLVKKGTEELWKYKDINVCKISMVGSDINAKLPIVVDCRGLTYSNILEKASSELPAEYRFTFSTNGALDRAFGRNIGQFGKDGQGVYVVLVDVNGKIKDRMYRNDLSIEPSPQNRNNTLVFMRQGLEDVYNYRRLYPASVISNCLSYVANSKNVRDEDLFVCAMLSCVKGDYTLFGQFLSQMEKIDKFLNTDEDKSLALRLIIQSDNIEYFKNLNSRLKWMDKYDGKERTMLGYAAEKGSLNIVKWLLEEAPEHERPNIDRLVPCENKKPTGDAGKTPLFWAAKNGHLEVCQYLVSKGADFERKFYEENNGESEQYDELVDKSYISDDRCRKYVEAEREVLEIRNRWFRWAGNNPTDATGEKIRDWVEAGVPSDRYLGGDWNLLSWAVELQDDSLVEFLTSKESSNEVRELLLKAKEGDADAMNKLGTRYVKGNGVTSIHKVAFYWFAKSAELNNIKGILNLAKCYRDGDGVKKDAEKYNELVEKANELHKKANQ